MVEIKVASCIASTACMLSPFNNNNIKYNTIIITVMVVQSAQVVMITICPTSTYRLYPV